MATLLEMLVEMVGLFGEVALNDPLAAVALLFGFVLFGATFGVAGLLAAGAAVEFVATAVGSLGSGEETGS